jgi:hypothetical protein
MWGLITKYMRNIKLRNYMYQSSSWEADSRLASQI